MKRDDVKILNKELIYPGFCRVERYALQNKLFSGAWSEPYTRELVVKPKVASALPYDPVLDKVILIEQFRAGALEDEQSPWLLEVVAGIMDKDNENSLEELITRELKEEAGVEPLELFHICDYWVTPGGCTEKVKLFCAKVDASKVPAFCGMPEEHEDIKIHVLSREDAFAALHSGTIKNSAAIIAVQWLELNWQRVRQMWL